MNKNYSLEKLRNYPGLALVFWGLISLGFIVSTDRFFYNLFENAVPFFSMLADLRLTSLCLIVIIYISVKKFYLLQHEVDLNQRKSTFILCICWLVVTTYFVLVQKVWVPALKDWVDVIAFMVTGLIVEEILFRGIIFDLAREVFGHKKIWNFSMAVLISAVLFGIQHFSYHDFIINTASVTQVFYTMIMGVVFAKLREASGNLWFVIFFHMLNNSMTLIRNFGF